MPAHWLRWTRPHLLMLATLVIVSCTGGTTPRDPEDDTPDSTVSTFSKSYGGPMYDEASVVLESEDGGFMLFGSAEGESVTFNGTFGFDGAPLGGDFWVQKLDANGNVEHSRTIGLRSANPANTTWKVARPTPDGGAVLIGTREQKETIERPGGESEVLVVDSDIAIARIDSSGNTLWSVTHDSGAWQNYEYFHLDPELPTARDEARDVWPLRDGGFLVAATSRANLRDEREIGYLCDDEELNEFGERDVGQMECDGYDSNASATFLGAMSVVVMRVNADGSLGWVRRLFDNPYDKYNNKADIGLMIRGTADGGSILARAVGRNSILVRRLAEDGAPLWRTAIYGAAPEIQVDTGSSRPRGLIETQDGFAVAGVRRVIQLNANGSVRSDDDFDLDVELPRDHQMEIHALSHQCDGTNCYVIAAGAVRTQALPLVDPDLARDDAFVAFLDDDGDLRARVFSVQDDGPVFRSFNRIAVAGNSLELLGPLVDGTGMGAVTLAGEPDSLNYRNLRRMTELSAGDDVDLRGPAGLVVLKSDRSSVQYRDAQGALQATTPLDAGFSSTEVLRAAAHLGSGRYLLAGTMLAPGDQSGLVVLRYDYNQDGARVVWQRRLPTRGGMLADISSMVPSGDGSAVIAMTFWNGDSPPQGSLLKLDANGDRQWQARLAGHPVSVQRMPDGGFAALTYSRGNSATHITRVSAAGALIWHNQVALPEGKVATMVARPDGGLVLAGSRGALIDLVWIAADGTLESASRLRLPGDSRLAPSFENLRMAPTADGGVVLAMTETGLLLDDTAQALPLGQTNVLVLKVDSGSQTVWSRVYGARYNEGVHDLAIREDGTIAVAGYSDSLGERRNAWLLKLSPYGMISDSGCQALLASLPPALAVTVARAATVSPEVMATGEVFPLPDFVEYSAPQRSPTDYETARQCLGDARAGRPAGVVQRLEVQQTGNTTGVVTSTPAGISCGTALNICRADFANGTRVSLSADPERFVRWVTECDEGSGGSSLTCVVNMDRPRRIEVEVFQPPPPPPPPQTFTLEFTVHNRGFVSTDSGITCTEIDSVATCSQDLPVGTVVNAMAVPDSGLVVFTWGDADPLCRSFGRERSVQFTLDRDVRCQVQFSTDTPGLRFDLDVVGVGGYVRDEDRPNDLNCRDLDFDNRCRIFLPANTRMVLAAYPADGWHFGGWGGDCESFVGPVNSYNLVDDMECLAFFYPDVARLTVVVDNATVGRNVTSQPVGIECSSDPGSDCTEDFPPNLRITLRASPAGFRGWQGCDRVVDVNYCEVDMTQPRTVTATFTP